MADVKKEIAKMMNDALALEHAARIQYLSHAEVPKGENAEKIIERLKELASDENKHEEQFRQMLGSYLDSIPVMSLAKTESAGNVREILEVNLRKEKEAIDIYKNIYKKIIESKAGLSYEFEVLEHEMRHIIMDEQEHVAELSLLLGL